MATDNPFDISGAATESESEASRRKKLSTYSLKSLFAGSNESQADSADLQEQPLHGGNISRSVSAEAGEPSQLATERVERAPSSQEASPLLPPAERLGNVLTGEEGGYGPLTGEQRSVSLRSLFPGIEGAPRSGQGAQGAGQSVNRNVGGVEQSDDESAGPPAGLRELGYAKQGLSAASTLDKNTGSNFDKYLRSLFTSGGQYTPGPTLGPNNFLGGAEGPSSYGDVFAPEAFTPSGPSMGPNTYLGAAEGPSSYGDVFDTGGVSSAGDTGAGGAGGTGSYLSGGASLLGLIASIYGLSSGAEVTPGMVINLLQSGITTASQLAGLAAAAAPASAAASSAASSLSALSAATGPVLGVAGAGVSVAGGLKQLESEDVRSRYNGLAQLIGGPAAGYMSSWITQNMGQPDYIQHREGAAAEAQTTFERYRNELSGALGTGDVMQMQQLLGQSPREGVSGALLNLPKDVAKAIGITPDAAIQDLTIEQFVSLLKAYSDREGANQNWFTATANIPYLTAEPLPGGQPGPAKQLVDAISETANSAFKAMVQGYAGLLSQLPPIAPLSWEDVGNGYRLSPELEYQKYLTDYDSPRWVPSTYEEARQGALGYTSGPLMYTGGGTRLNQTFMDPSYANHPTRAGLYAPSDLFANEAGKTQIAGIPAQLQQSQDTVVSEYAQNATPEELYIINKYQPALMQLILAEKERLRPTVSNPYSSSSQE